MRLLEEAIRANDKEPNWLRRAIHNVDVAKRAVEDTIEEAKNDEGIFYHRYYLPAVLSKWLFYQKRFEWECIAHSSTTEDRGKFLLQQLEQARDFFYTHRRFIRYYFSKQTREDGRLFLPDSPPASGPLPPDDERVFAVNPNSLLAGYILAHYEYVAFLQKECGEDGGPSTNTVAPGCNDIDYVELALAIWAGQMVYVNGKPATQEYIRSKIEKMANVQLPYFDNQVQDLKRRKKDPTALMNRLTKGLAMHLGKLPDDRSTKG